MNEKIKNNREEVIKIFLTQSEKSLVKSHLENYNNINPDNRKSISEFLREIILKNLLKIQNDLEDKNLDNFEKIYDGDNFKKIEKILNRNIFLTYKILEKIFGEKETENILNEMKNGE
ncbi:MAG: hypothetical protein LBQ13_01325 [Endomicrobium sp.]|jgi:hypothetical protein|nr:hypothetical protein [Endomicrobium sp.]